MLNLPPNTLIGVVHLLPLPGSPRHQLPVDEIIARAVTDGRRLKNAGFDAAIIENFGDAPFTGTDLPPASLACMAVVADQVRRQCGIPIGINALRNDARAALSIAVATSARFIRVNVHTGVYATDQGMIEGTAYESLSYRKLLGARIAVLADVHVKHSSAISHPDLASAAKDTAYRGLADALIVTGAATGETVDRDDIATVRAAVPDRRLFVGSGATADSVSELLVQAGGVIVGSGIKAEGNPENAIDESLALAFARAAGRGSR